MNRLQWIWERSTHTLGYSAITLLFLTALTIIIEAVGIYPRQQRVAALNQDVEKASRTLERAQLARPAAMAAEKLLPPLSGLNADLATLHKLAGDNGLLLQKADYQLGREGSYWRYQVNSEGEFSYPAVSQFVGAALTLLPHLALDNLSLSRASADNGRPTLELGLSFYFADNDRAGQP